VDGKNATVATSGAVAHGDTYVDRVIIDGKRVAWQRYEEFSGTGGILVATIGSDRHARVLPDRDVLSFALHDPVLVMAVRAEAGYELLSYNLDTAKQGLLARFPDAPFIRGFDGTRVLLWLEGSEDPKLIPDLVVLDRSTGKIQEVLEAEAIDLGSAVLAPGRVMALEAYAGLRSVVVGEALATGKVELVADLARNTTAIRPIAGAIVARDYNYDFWSWRSGTLTGLTAKDAGFIDLADFSADGRHAVVFMINQGEGQLDIATGAVKPLPLPRDAGVAATGDLGVAWTRCTVECEVGFSPWS
jgi:hypothetical protein